MSLREQILQARASLGAIQSDLEEWEKTPEWGRNSEEVSMMIDEGMKAIQAIRQAKVALNRMLKLVKDGNNYDEMAESN
ncbi:MULTISPECIES: hypothetical protein [unclassified Sinorhizobium]|uniref:hypothetical protein n=1 Tax=unclassified Sinorhizobium TaxID=2613772 RepID=UPI0035245A3D